MCDSSIIPCRHDSDSDTVSTDSDQTWGGKGHFEYTQKVLPHALVHVPEIVMRAGHHAGACSFLSEVSHKRFIKIAAKLGRTFGSQNRTEEEMLKWTLTDKIYVDAAIIAKRTTECLTINESSNDDADSEGFVNRTFTNQLPPFMTTTPPNFLLVGNSELLRISWETGMISKKVRVTRRELLTFVCEKLGFPDSRETRTALVRLRLQIHIWFFKYTFDLLKYTFSFKNTHLHLSPSSQDYSSI